MTEEQEEQFYRLIKTKLAKSKGINGEKETIWEHTECLKKEAARLLRYGYISEEEYRLLDYAVEKHDYGKLNDQMQKRLRTGKTFDAEKEVRHNILSGLFVNPEDFDSWDDYIVVLYAVLYHHENYGDNRTQASVLADRNPIINKFKEEYSEYIYQPNMRTTRRIVRLTQTQGIDEDGESSYEDEYLYQRMAKMKGLLHKCDYSASAHIACEYKNDFLVEALEQLATAWKSGWNELQRFTQEHTNENLIVTAPTGSGKTEAGLLWAGVNKCFFVLPLRTAINAMYDRIRGGILHNESTDTRIALLHSEMQAYYLEKSTSEKGKSDEEEPEEELLTYVTRSKQMALPLTIATLDQIFRFTLKYYGYEYILATLSYSKLIIDEVQMYSPDLLAYLIYGIKTVIEYGGKVAVITATLPPFVKDKLYQVMGNDVAERDFSGIKADRHNVKVMDEPLTSEAIWDVWKKKAGEDSRKFLVICNSVKTAQRLYRELEELTQQENVRIHLLHSKFTGDDRKKKEQEILEVGETGRKTHEIWIATSVVEASLDIDFDYLFTELLDLFSLFQRMGRVNRKGIKDIDEVNCYVYLQLQDSPLRCFQSQNSRYRFVDNDIYLLSKEAMETVDGILSETKKTNLINEYLSAEKLEKTGYVKQYEQTYRELEMLNIEEKSTGEMIRDIQTVDIIPAGVYNEHKDVIDTAEQKLRERDAGITEKLQAMEDIRRYVVPVPGYIVYGNKRRSEAVERYIRIRRNVEIPVVACEYSSEIGFEKIYKKETERQGSHII